MSKFMKNKGLLIIKSFIKKKIGSKDTCFSRLSDFIVFSYFMLSLGYDRLSNDVMTYPYIAISLLLNMYQKRIWCFTSFQFLIVPTRTYPYPAGLYQPLLNLQHIKEKKNNIKNTAIFLYIIKMGFFILCQVKQRLQEPRGVKQDGEITSQKEK